MSKPKLKDKSNFIKALEFVGNAQKLDNKTTWQPFQTHCQIRNQSIVAFDGVISAGCKIEEDLIANPHTYSLINALSYCDNQNLNITQLDQDKLSIKSGKFSAVVPCLIDNLPVISPDTPTIEIGEVLREGLGKVSHLAVDSASKVILSAVLLQSGSLVATSGYVILEYWHGLGLGLPKCVLPKVSVSALLSVDKKLVKLGYSNSSCTFWFEDDSWLKTQLYAEQFPSLDNIFNCNDSFTQFPATFYDSLRQIESFAEGKEELKTVFISEEGLRSHKDVNKGAFYEFKGFPKSAFRIKQLKQVEKIVQQYCLKDNRLYLYGDKIRGVVMGVTQ